ncbi:MULTISPECIES: hypothetical protein [unclassified Streptomyces]|uniref:hypothetical protein n=1 Tax=unclassified Streptomyces TaxID=2593676 RepID=UPI0036E673ED
MKQVCGALVLYAVLALMIRFADGGVGWGQALSAALVGTPLVMWMVWLRSRLMDQARDWGRRKRQPWPEERRR